MLFRSTKDILEELNIVTRDATSLPGLPEPESIRHLDNEHSCLLEYITYDPISIDKLVEHTGLTVTAISSMLLTMELHGIITTTTGGCYARIK